MKRIYTGDRRECKRLAAVTYRRRNPVRSRKQWTRSRRRSLEKQCGRPKPDHCDICGRKGVYGGKKRICFDHDHVTMKFRGWLCHHCNLILGHANDSPELLRKLANYLEAARSLAA